MQDLTKVNEVVNIIVKVMTFNFITRNLLFSSFHLELFSEKTFFAAYLLHANEGTNRLEEHMNAEWKFNIRSHNKYVVIQKLRVLMMSDNFL